MARGPKEDMAEEVPLPADYLPADRPARPPLVRLALWLVLRLPRMGR